MNHRQFRILVLLVLGVGIVSAVPAPLTPSNWTMFGGTQGRNMVNLNDHGLPHDFDPLKGTGVLWKTELGTRCYTQPVISGSRVFIGINNKNPRNPRDMKGDEPIDKGILLCLDSATGKFLWQAVHDRRPMGGVVDWPWEGMCSTPIVENDRLYYLSPIGEVVCADVNGFANGNQGRQDEKYTDATDADFIWSVDLVKEYDVHVHNVASCSPLIVGDTLFLVTGNGVDEGHINIPSIEAPSFLALDKRTGKLLWKDSSPGKKILHGQWSSPAFTTDPVPQVIFPGGDGLLRGFDPKSGKLLWSFDGDPRRKEGEVGGGPDSRNDFLGTPVVVDGRVYIGTGQDPEHTTGPADFWCLDLRKIVDGKPTVVWNFGSQKMPPFAVREFAFGRTMSTACVVGNVLYVAELAGFLHCLDAKTGNVYWTCDTQASHWGSPYYADGKIFLGNDSGEMFVFEHRDNPPQIGGFDIQAPTRMEAKVIRKSRQAEIERQMLLAKIDVDVPIRTTVSVTGNVLYLPTEKTLYAIGTRP